MLEARKASLRRFQYELVADGQPLTNWDGRLFPVGGTFDLAGQRYEVKSHIWNTRFDLTDEAGTTVATADKVGRKSWTVEAGGRTYRFQRAARWLRSEVLMVNDGKPVGSVRRVSRERGDAVADLRTYRYRCRSSSLLSY